MQKETCPACGKEVVSHRKDICRCSVFVCSCGHEWTSCRIDFKKGEEKLKENLMGNGNLINEN